jgi:hypothetical protein
MIRVRLPIGREVAITPVREPCGTLAGVVVLEELMDPAAAQAGRGGDLSDGQPRVVGRNDGPEALALGLCKPRGGQAEPCVQGWFAPDAWPPWLTRLHPSETSGVSLDCLGNWTGERLVLFPFSRKATLYFCLNHPTIRLNSERPTIANSFS